MLQRAIGLSIVLLVLFCLFGCSGGNAPAAPATTIVTLSDPVTCGTSTAGPFRSVYVTIADVQIHASATAGPNDPGWTSLTPDLPTAPHQVDLLNLPKLGTANDGCFLANLGSTTRLQPGTYQQIRLILADSFRPPAGTTDSCKGVAANCVVLSTDLDGNNPVALQLSSEARTGLKIPPGQIAGGQFTIAAGETKDLNIDFDACASIVIQADGKFRLKPVLHAGEVALTQARPAITGKITVNDKPLVGGKAIVALEKNGRFVMQTTPDGAGIFVFCPVPNDLYDVVAVGVDDAGVAYAATITTGVRPGNNLGNVPLIAGVGKTLPASLNGATTTVNGGGTGVGVDVVLTVLQQVQTHTYTIPLAQQSSTTETVQTASNASCPGVACANYELSVPTANPTVGAFSANGTQYSAADPPVDDYTVEGAASNCSSSPLTKNVLDVTAGINAVETMAFTGCQ